MPRPRRKRRIRFRPDSTYFKPAGIPMRNLEETILTYSEVEALRLVDVEKESQKEAAKKMEVSQPTFSRLLCSGRKKLAKAVVNGQAIRIQGGVYKIANQTAGPGAGQGRGPGRQGRGGRFRAPPKGRGRRMRGDKPGSGPVGLCICPNCGHKEKHARGQPCNQLKCSECGRAMTRE